MDQVNEIDKLKTTVKSQSYQIADLRKRVKRLEEKDSYYPNVEEIGTLPEGFRDYPE